VVECRIRVREVAGSSLTHCAVGTRDHGQAGHAHLLLLPSSTTWY